ncbi:MAG: calcium/sodium antiporter [Candidatus Cryptobacteroides sp.]
MLTQFLILASGLILILLGANWLVDGSSSIAKKAGMSEFVIGLTIVGIGTSMPELVVSCTGAFQGNSDIAIGNVIGSNIFNVMLILGITALICPVTITKTNRNIDIPLNLAVTLVLMLLGMKQTIFGAGGNQLNRIEGILMLLVFALYLYVSFRKGKNTDSEADDEVKLYKTPVAVVMILFGLGALVGGGQLFVNSAVELARMFNVSDKFIAITILAGGTSLPELATCIVAAAKKRSQLALGNILGSNISNILLILGAAATITPLSFGNISVVDIAAITGSATFLVICGLCFRKRARLGIPEGLILLLMEVVYMTLLIRSVV